VTISPAQMAKIDGTIQQLAAKVPSTYQRWADFIITVFGSLFVIFRFAYGFFSHDGTLAGSVWKGLVNVIFHAPATSGTYTTNVTAKGAALLKSSLLLLGVASLTMLGVGCFTVDTTKIYTPQLICTTNAAGAAVTVTNLVEVKEVKKKERMFLPNGYAMVSMEKGVGVKLTTSTTSANEMPQGEVGAFSIFWAMYPTSTNGPIYAPALLSKATGANQWNPFDFNISEDIGVGSVQLQDSTSNTNTLTSGAIVPSAPAGSVTK
jgi:hypothetical protein